MVLVESGTCRLGRMAAAVNENEKRHGAGVRSLSSSIRASVGFILCLWRYTLRTLISSLRLAIIADHPSGDGLMAAAGLAEELNFINHRQKRNYAPRRAAPDLLPDHHRTVE